MDKHQLTIIAVTAVITAIARELVSLVAKQSTKATGAAKQVVTRILSRHGLIVMMAVDILIFVVIGWVLFSAMFSDKPVTSGQAVGIAMNCIMWFYWPRKLAQDFHEYRIQRQRPSA